MRNMEMTIEYRACTTSPLVCFGIVLHIPSPHKSMVHELSFPPRQITTAQNNQATHHNHWRYEPPFPYNIISLRFLNYRKFFFLITCLRMTSLHTNCFYRGEFFPNLGGNLWTFHAQWSSTIGTMDIIISIPLTDISHDVQSFGL